jgi:hypothetical protein
MNQCIRLSQSLLDFSNSRPVDEIKIAIVGIVSILGNLRSVNLQKLSFSLSLTISNFYQKFKFKKGIKQLFKFERDLFRFRLFNKYSASYFL